MVRLLILRSWVRVPHGPPLRNRRSGACCSWPFFFFGACVPHEHTGGYTDFATDTGAAPIGTGGQRHSAHTLLPPRPISTHSSFPKLTHLRPIPQAHPTQTYSTRSSSRPSPSRSRPLPPVAHFIPGPYQEKCGRFSLRMAEIARNAVRGSAIRGR